MARNDQISSEIFGEWGGAARIYRSFERHDVL
jgi:hypothetical protein